MVSEEELRNLVKQIASAKLSNRIKTPQEETKRLWNSLSINPSTTSRIKPKKKLQGLQSNDGNRKNYVERNKNSVSVAAFHRYGSLMNTHEVESLLQEKLTNHELKKENKIRETSIIKRNMQNLSAHRPVKNETLTKIQKIEIVMAKIEADKKKRAAAQIQKQNKIYSIQELPRGRYDNDLSETLQTEAFVETGGDREESEKVGFEIETQNWAESAEEAEEVIFDEAADSLGGDLSEPETGEEIGGDIPDKF